MNMPPCHLPLLHLFPGLWSSSSGHAWWPHVSEPVGSSARGLSITHNFFWPPNPCGGLQRSAEGRPWHGTTTEIWGSSGSGEWCSGKGEPQHIFSLPRSVWKGAKGSREFAVSEVASACDCNVFMHQGLASVAVKMR